MISTPRQTNPPGVAFAAAARHQRLFYSEVIDADMLERVITEVGEKLADVELPRADRPAVWLLFRSLIAMRSKERVAEMEREQKLR